MTETIVIFRLIFSAILSGIVGLDREKAEKSAGMRTLMLTSVACTVFTLIPFYLLEITGNFDFSRCIHGIMTGIGFLGAGVIMTRGKDGLEGTTTAALIFACASLGTLVGLGNYRIAVVLTIILFNILKLKHLERKLHEKWNK